MDSIKTDIKSKELDSIYELNKPKTFLKINDPFNTLNFERERNRLYELFKNSGFYNFQINSISFEVSRDTTGLDLRLPVLINIDDKNSTNQNKYKIHKIGRVNLYTDDPESIVTNKKMTEFENIKIYSSGELRYKPEFLTELISFSVDDVYSDLERSKTIKRFNNLDDFKYPSISYNYVDDTDNLLESNILLSAKKGFH